MPSEKMRRRLDRLRGNMLPPDQIPGAIRSLTTLIAGGLKTDEEAAEVAGRYEKVLGPDGARELRDMLVWARARLAERNEEAMRVLLAEHGVDLDTASDEEIDAALAAAFPAVPAYARRGLRLAGDPALQGPEVLWSETWPLETTA